MAAFGFKANMKSITKPRLKLYLLIGGMALLLTLAVKPLLPRWFEKYTADIKEDQRIFPNPNLLDHDFDHDGFSELAALKYQEDIDEPALKIYAYNGGLIDQWTFEERWLPRSMTFGDYDHNGSDEAYVFTRTRDSLFLYGIDPRRPGQFIVQRAFIARAPIGNKRWDLRPIAGVFLDADKDGYDELVFNVMAGKAQQPRRLFSFSIRHKKMLGQSPPGSAFLALPQKISRPQNEYILMGGSISLANTRGRTHFSDQSAWLAVFDARLNFAFPPVEFSARHAEVTALPFGYGDKEIIALVKYGGKGENFVSLSVYNWQGVQIQSREFRGREWKLFQAEVHGARETFLFNSRENSIARVNEDLRLGPPVRLSRKIEDILTTAFDLDGDYSNEWLARSGDELLIVQNNFSHILRTGLIIKGIGNANISLKKRGAQQPLLSVQNEENQYLLRYRINPFYPLHHLSWVLLFILFSLLVWAALALLNKLAGYNFILRTLIRNPDRGILILNNRGVIKKANHTLIDQFHLETIDIQNRHYSVVFAELAPLRQFIRNLMSRGRHINEDVVITDRNFSFRGRLFGRPIKGILNYPAGFYFETNDYARPVQSDRLKVWSKTVQKMAHDIKTPLSSISLNISAVQKKLSDKAPETLQFVGEDIDLMLKEMERVREMTKNFLKFTNLERPLLQVFSLGALVQEITDDFRSYYTDTLDFEVKFDYPQDVIRADRAQLKMALKALLENAIDAVKGSGLVGLSVSQVHQIDKGFDEAVEIEVYDNGPGVAADLREQLFEPYFTTKAQGTGMGLAIAKKIIEDHHGTIELVSGRKFATVFRLMLPVGNICV